MGTPQADLIVKETCNQFPKEDCIATNQQYQFMIDPCSCNHYYNCIDYEPLRVACSGGTAFNHNSKRCIHEDEVIFKGICYRETPWTRCNVTGNHLDEIIKRCGGHLTTQSTTVTVQHTQAPPAVTENHTGLIVGCIIAGIFLIAFLVLFYLVWKKKIPLFRPKEESQPVQNPEYFNKIENIYEDYAEIDDVPNMLSEKRPSLPNRQLSSNNSTPNDIMKENGNPRKESNASQAYVEPVQTLKKTQVVYDNPALVVHEQSIDSNMPDTNKRLYIDIVENNNIPLSQKKNVPPTDQLSNENSDSDYFVLQKE